MTQTVAEQEQPKLSHGVRWSFGIGQMAEGIKNSSFSAFLLFYYNQVLGLPAETAGLAIAISLIFDAVTDPLIGTISDRSELSFGGFELAKSSAQERFEKAIHV